jgi:hypothetical protein
LVAREPTKRYPTTRIPITVTRSLATPWSGILSAIPLLRANSKVMRFPIIENVPGWFSRK